MNLSHGRDMRNKGWFWLDDEYLNGYAKHLGTTATCVYLCLCRYVGKDQTCFPKLETISKELGIAKNTTITAIKKLEKWKIVEITREYDNKKKKQKANVYLLLDKQYWIQKPEQSANNEPSPEQGANNEPSPEQGANNEKSRVQPLHRKVYNTLTKQIHTVADATEWSFKEEIKKIVGGERKDLKIIILYWIKKNMSFENKEQFQKNLKRELRPANDLIGYSKSQIEQSMDYCEKEYKVWTLETCFKRIGDLINKK